MENNIIRTGAIGGSAMDRADQRAEETVGQAEGVK